MRRSVRLLGALLVSLPILAHAQAPQADGPPVRLVDDGAAALAPQWSPDGTRLAFTRAAYRGLWTVDAEGGAARELTDAAAAGFGFAWSPDGAAILARPARYDGRDRLNAVVVYGLDGTARELTEWESRAAPLPQWAGAGAVAVLGRGGPSGASGQAVEVLTLGDGARVAPGGAVAFAADGGLAVADAATGAVRSLNVAGGRLVNVTPSPDGTRVAFEVVGGNLYTVGLDGSGLADLGRGHRPTWSPDGEWVAFMVTEDDGEAFTASDLWAARADGAGRVRITQTPDRLEMNPAWSPDGGRLAYDDYADGALYVLPLAR